MGISDRVGQYRKRMRGAGYRSVQMWVLDVRGDQTRAEARRQADLVAAADRTSDDQQFIEAVSAPWGEE
ncbi:antitoxin MazE family protein [Microbacterium halotolerans]|uniref:antitoxin MazE family protein n=1 Tax=Microbacterium halotolerans TaxID=246613 RepID=UPI000E6AAEC0|nr:antitoxin MazE family protein [Microbacterium halotolerans]